MQKSRPIWPLITAVLIGLPVLYVGTFGPACWLGDRSDLLRPYIIDAYVPLMRLASHLGQPAAATLYRWGAISGTIDLETVGEIYFVVHPNAYDSQYLF